MKLKILKNEKGEPVEFESRFLIPIMEEYEADEKRLLDAKARPLEFVKLRARYLERVLCESLPKDFELRLELTGRQATEAFIQLYRDFYGADEDKDESPLPA